MATNRPKVLPKIIKPHSFAKQNLMFVGKYNLFKLPRLAGFLEKDSNLELSLNFSKKDNLDIAIGSLFFDVFLPCVNCLELIKFDFSYDIKLVFARADVKIPEGFELIEVADNFTEINTFDFISEEILLRLPEFPKHSNKCIDLMNNKQQNKDNGFSLLKNLIK